MSLIEKVSIVKATGENELYSRDKLVNALLLAGADRIQSESIADLVEANLYEGIPSAKIHQLAYSSLRKKRSHRTAGRYRLKKAILDLGPSGYPFEIFIGKLFTSFGYQVKVGETIMGNCVSHEVDVVATKEDEVVIVEAKFHCDSRAKTNVRVPLYIQSRFNDIKAKWKDDPIYRDKNIRGFVTTNTRFTMDAIKFAECVGLGLISWDYPQTGSLKYFIDQSGLHPITSLRSMIKAEKKKFLEKGIVLCQELFQHQGLMTEMGFNQQKINRILKEADLLIRS